MMLFAYFKIAESLVDLSYLHSRLVMIFSERFAFSLIDMKLSHKKLIAEKKKELKHWDDFKRYFLIFKYLHWNLDSFHKRELNKSDSFQANFGRTVFVLFSSLYLKRWACTNGYSKPHQTRLAVDALERFFQNLWRPGGDKSYPRTLFHNDSKDINMLVIEGTQKKIQIGQDEHLMEPRTRVFSRSSRIFQKQIMIIFQ